MRLKFLIGLLVATPLSMPAQNLVTNGDFETHTISGWTGVNVPGSTPGFGGSSFAIQGYYSVFFYGGGTAPGDATGFMQSIATIAGHNYNISFLTNDLSTNDNGHLFASFGNTTLFNQAVGNITYPASDSFSFTAIANGTSTALTFIGFSNQQFLALDGISVTDAGGPVSTTPEPSSMALLGTGLFGLIPMVRRKK